MSDKTTSVTKSIAGTRARNPFSWVNRLSGKMYRAIGGGILGRYMTSYDETCEKHKRSYFVRLAKMKKHKCRLTNGYYAKQESYDEAMTEEERKGLAFYTESSVSRSWRNRFSAWFDNSWSVNLLRSVRENILYTPLISYGVLIFAFALFMLISQSLTLLFFSNGIVIPYLSHINSVDAVVIVTYMATAIVLMTTALMLIFAKEGSLLACLLEGRISGYFLRNFMGVRFHTPEKTRRRHNGRSFALGVVFGLITFFVPPARFFSALGILVLVSSIVCIPEFGLIALIFLIPFYTDENQATVKILMLMALVFFSCILKLMRGKRKLTLEPIDLYVMLFLLLVLFGGVLSMGGKESLTTALIMVALACVYFVTVTLVRGEDWLNRCVCAFLLSASLLSCFGILMRLLSFLRSFWEETPFLSDVFHQVLIRWQDYEILKEYLVIAVLVSVGCLFGQKGVSFRFGAFVTAALSVAYLILSVSTNVWLVLVLMLSVLFLIYSHKALPWIGGGVACACVAFLLLPEEIIRRVTSFMAMPEDALQYRIGVWNGCSKLLRKCFLTGVGVGEAAFSVAYDGFALIGLETAPHSYSFWLQILIQLGITGAFVLIVLILTSVRSAFTLYRVRTFSCSVSVMNLSFLTALFSLLVFGITDYIWMDYRVYMLFFLLLGLMISSARIGMRGRGDREKEECSYDMILSLGRTGARSNRHKET